MDVALKISRQLPPCLSSDRKGTPETNNAYARRAKSNIVRKQWCWRVPPAPPFVNYVGFRTVFVKSHTPSHATFCGLGWIAHGARQILHPLPHPLPHNLCQRCWISHRFRQIPPPPPAPHVENYLDFALFTSNPAPPPAPLPAPPFLLCLLR